MKLFRLLTVSVLCTIIALPTHSYPSLGFRITARRQNPTGQESAQRVQAAIDFIRSQARAVWAYKQNAPSKHRGTGPDRLTSKISGQLWQIDTFPLGDPAAWNQLFEAGVLGLDVPSLPSYYSALNQYITLYRQYLVDGNDKALRAAAPAVESQLDPTTRAALGRSHMLYKAGDGPEFFEKAIAICGGFFRFHIEHLKTHLAYIQSMARSVPDAGMPNPDEVCKVKLGSGAERSYSLGKLIGKGLFAHVYQLKDEAGNLVPFVMKFYKDLHPMWSNGRNMGGISFARRTFFSPTLLRLFSNQRQAGPSSYNLCWTGPKWKCSQRDE